jgi:hypothetical protein
MVNSSDWKAMKQRAFEAFKTNGRMSVSELQEIVEIGCADGEFDEQERTVLINVITNLTRADMTEDMWAKVDELIHNLDLHHDSEATIERLEDDEGSHS